MAMSLQGITEFIGKHLIAKTQCFNITKNLALILDARELIVGVSWDIVYEEGFVANPYDPHAEIQHCTVYTYWVYLNILPAVYLRLNYRRTYIGELIDNPVLERELMKSVAQELGTPRKEDTPGETPKPSYLDFPDEPESFGLS